MFIRFLALLAMGIIALSPVAARDLQYTAVVGKPLKLGHWYHITNRDGCKTAALPKVVWVKKPTTGTFQIETLKVEPRQCPGKQINAVHLSYTPTAAGVDEFSYLIEYVSALEGDWHYNVKTKNIAVPAN